MNKHYLTVSWWKSMCLQKIIHRKQKTRIKNFIFNQVFLLRKRIPSFLHRRSVEFLSRSVKTGKFGYVVFKLKAFQRISVCAILYLGSSTRKTHAIFSNQSPCMSFYLHFNSFLIYLRTLFRHNMAYICKIPNY